MRRRANPASGQLTWLNDVNRISVKKVCQARKFAKKVRQEKRPRNTGRQPTLCADFAKLQAQNVKPHRLPISGLQYQACNIWPSITGPQDPVLQEAVLQERGPQKPGEMPMSDDVVIVSAARTAVGSFNGAFATTPAHHLGALAIQA